MTTFSDGWSPLCKLNLSAGAFLFLIIVLQYINTYNLTIFTNFMFKEFARKLFYADGTQPEVGVNETWYAANFEQERGIMTTSDVISQAIGLSKARHPCIAHRDSSQVTWNPYYAAVHTDVYLVAGSNVIINELKDKSGDSLRFFPEFVLSIISETEERLRKTAEHLKLPLDDLVLEESKR